MTTNRIFPDDDPPPYHDGHNKRRQVAIRQAAGPFLDPIHETIETEDEILLMSVGGQTRLEAAAVEIAVALINAEAVNIEELTHDAALQSLVAVTAVNVAGNVLATAERVEADRIQRRGK